MKRPLVWCLVMAALAAPLAAQDARLSRLDPATAAEIGAIVAAARVSGLPTEPLVDRALEGASKGASPSRIVAAARALARDLQASRNALGTADDAEVAAGAGALRAGADAHALQRLRGARRTTALTVPLGVLADLIARGVPTDTASRVVVRLAEAGAADAEFVALRRNVERDIRAGAPPALAASLRARGMPSTLPPVFAPGGAVSAPAGGERATSPGARP